MIKTYRFSKLLPEEILERIKLLKNSFTGEQLKVLEELGASVVMEAEDSEGKKSFSIIDSNESENLRYAKNSEKGFAAPTADREFLKWKAYVNSQVEIIKSIKESPNTPYRKLTDLIVKVSYDYDSRKLGELNVILPGIRKRFSNSRVDEIVVEFILTIAESDVKQGVWRSMRQWYETIIAIADKWQLEGEEKKRLQEENVSLQKQLRTMTKELGVLKERIQNDLALHRRSIEEIDKWHGMYEETEREAAMWQSKYEEARESNKKAEAERQEIKFQEIERLKQENAKQQRSIEQLQHLLDNGFNIVATAKKYIDREPVSSDFILNRFSDNEEYKKKVSALEKEIKELRDKQEQLQETEEYKAAIAEMKNELGKSYIRLDSIAKCILRLPTFDLQYSAFQQITALLTGTSWSEKAAEVLETMFAKVKEQQDRQEQKQDKMIRTVKEAANKPTTQNILNLELVNKKETNIDKNYGPNIEHNGGTLTLPDKY